MVLRTSFCFSQNTRGAICTYSLTSELVDSRRLIIVLDKFSHLGFVFFENVNVDIRGDFGIAMTEVLGNCLNIISVITTKSSAEAELFVYRNNPKLVIISWRTEERDERPSDRTSFSPSYEGHE